MQTLSLRNKCTQDLSILSLRWYHLFASSSNLQEIPSEIAFDIGKFFIVLEINVTKLRNKDKHLTSSFLLFSLFSEGIRLIP